MTDKDKVVSIDELKKQKVLEQNPEELTTFQSIIEQNKKNKERLQTERNKDNKKVLRNYRLKT